MNWITKIYRYHKEWIAMVQGLGGGLYSEDIVMEAYIKLHKYNCEDKIINDGKVRKGYMFFVLRSIFIEYIKQSNKIRRVNIDKLYDLNGKSWFVDLNSSSFNIRNLKEKAEKNILYQSDDVIKEYAYGRICSKIDNEIKTWHWYDKKMFELYKDTPLTIRAMSGETNISSTNIFHTLKKGKKIIKDKFLEDYQDYKNGDYDLI